MKRAEPTSRNGHRGKHSVRAGAELASDVLYQSSTLEWILMRSLEALWLIGTAAFSLLGLFGFYCWITGSAFTGRTPASVSLPFVWVRASLPASRPVGGARPGAACAIATATAASTALPATGPKVARLTVAFTHQTLSLVIQRARSA